MKCWYQTQQLKTGLSQALNDLSRNRGRSDFKPVQTLGGGGGSFQTIKAKEGMEGRAIDSSCEQGVKGNRAKVYFLMFWEHQTTPHRPGRLEGQNILSGERILDNCRST